MRQLREKVAEWGDADSPVDEGWDARFREAIADDVDLPRAMALVAELGKAPIETHTKAALLRAWDRVLGLDLGRSAAERSLPDGASERIAQLVAERDQARAARDFAKADRLREQLAGLGFHVADKPLKK